MCGKLLVAVQALRKDLGGYAETGWFCEAKSMTKPRLGELELAEAVVAAITVIKVEAEDCSAYDDGGVLEEEALGL